MPDSIEQGTKPKRCTTCQQLVKGHNGPTGMKCTNTSDIDGSTYTEDDERADLEGAVAGNSDQQYVDEKPTTMSKEQFDILVNIMTSINLNMEAFQKSNRDILKAVLEKPPTAPVKTGYTTSPPHMANIVTSSPHTDNIVSPPPHAYTIVTPHAVNIATPPPHADSIVTLPISGSTSEKTVKHALSGEFINLSDFLPNLSEPVTNLESYVDSDGTMQFKAKRPNRAIDSLCTWLSAWSNYEALLVSHNPSLYTKLASYRAFIQMCDKKYLWHAIYAYDCRFRSALSHSKSWDYQQVNNDLYITYSILRPSRKATSSVTGVNLSTTQ